MSTYVTTGFVLNARAWREGDRLYTIYTERQGKVELIAAGSQKSASKLAPHLAPFAQVEVMVARGKQFDRLAGASVHEVYLKPPYELPTVVLGTALLEVVDALTRPLEPEPRLHLLLQGALKELGGLPPAGDSWRAPARWLLAHFFVEALKLTGFGVQLAHCEQCRGELIDPVSFNWSRHGFFHQRHLPAGDSALVVSAEALVWFQRAARHGVARGDELPPSALAFLTDYVTGHVGRELYTLRVLRSIL